MGTELVVGRVFLLLYKKGWWTYRGKTEWRSTGGVDQGQLVSPSNQTCEDAYHVIT